MARDEDDELEDPSALNDAEELSEIDEVEAGATLARVANEISELRPLLATAVGAQLQESVRRALLTPGLQASVAQNLIPHLNLWRGSDFRFFKTLRANVLSSQFSTFSLDYDRLFRSALTQPSSYENPDPSRSPYSGRMTTTADYFANDEGVIDSFSGLTKAIDTLVQKAGGLQLVWRGARNANWGIHSNLYRRLLTLNGVAEPGKSVRGDQPYPDEAQMSAAEAELLKVARSNWRFDGMSALETFARIQHAGGPTRLLDVTKNPFVGAWFAVEHDESTEDEDARLIAFATGPVRKTDGAEPPSSQIELDADWGDRTPPWHLWTDPTARQAVDWGTGARRRFWVPPAYDPRIAAQNAGFILDGVPITSSKMRSYFKSSPPNEPASYWNRADLLAAASIYAKTFKPKQKPKFNQHSLAPTFTFRVKSEAKAEIREMLISRFGYTRSYIYPDMPALAAHLTTIDLPGLEAVEGV